MSRDVPTTKDPCDICGKNAYVCFDFMGDVVCTNCLEILEEKDAKICSLCSHEYRVHTGEREPHNTKCTTENCICGRFFIEPTLLPIYKEALESIKKSGHVTNCSGYRELEPGEINKCSCHVGEASLALAGRTEPFL